MGEIPIPADVVARIAKARRAMDGIRADLALAMAL